MEILVLVETELLDVTIKGPPPDRILLSFPSLHAGVASRTEVKGQYNAAEVYHAGLGKRLPLGPHPPLFFEEQSYEVLVELKEAGQFAFWHENPALRSLVHSVGRSGRVYSGVFNFGSEVGETEFVFLWNRQKVLSIQIEIFPRKLDYRLDYQQMLLEVHTEVHGLVFDLLAKTYRHVLPGRWERQTTELEWFSLLRHLFKNLERAVEVIARCPHHRLERKEQLRPVEIVRQPGPSARRWLRRHPELWAVVANHSPAGSPSGVSPALPGSTNNPGLDSLLGRAKFPEMRKRISYDTPENRFVRYVLEKTAARLRRLRAMYRETTGATAAVAALFDEMQKRVQRLLRMRFLQEVGPLRSRLGISLVLQFAPGYREVLRSYLILLRGLNIQGRALRIGLKSVHELYEYWCFLRLQEILSRRYPLITQDIIRTRANGIVLTLRKGDSGRVVFQDRDGSLIELGYNACPDVPSPTTPQRPDVLLTIDRRTPGGHHRYILDAKYRLEATPEYVSRYGGAGPKEDDVNVMHRYRDAFLAGEPAARLYSRDALGACVLFPWRGDFRGHHFHRSLQQVGIGALPFLPGATDLVEEFLDEILGWSDIEHINRAILPRNHDIFWGRRYRNNPVLVGTLGDKKHRERLEFARRFGYYHIPVDKFPASKLGFEYVAFFGDGKIEWYAQAGEVTVVPERELTEITRLRPLRSPGGQRLYYRVDLLPGSWLALSPPITNPTRQRFAFLTTTLEALLTARTIGELGLKQENERRLLEAIHWAGMAYEVTEGEDGRWELILDHGRAKIRPQVSVDGLEIWLPGAAAPQRIPGKVVRQRPEYILEVISKQGL